jgi:hypothetical protein
MQRVCGRLLGEQGRSGTGERGKEEGRNDSRSTVKTHD